MCGACWSWRCRVSSVAVPRTSSIDSRISKSQIAIEFTYQIVNSSPTTWVFWVHAETKERLREGYLQIAMKTSIDGCDEPGADVIQLVNIWLSNEASGSWVLVLDSADDTNVFLDDSSASWAPYIPELKERERDLSSILPQSPHGLVIITSRSHEVVCMLTGNDSSAIEVGAMNGQDASALLQKKFTYALRKDEADALISALDYMPLALTQAAAFINRTPRMSIAKYLEEINYDQAWLLDSDLLDIRRDATASNSITTTWQISFDYLRKRSPSAARLLSLTSLFDRRGIPNTLLEGRYTGHEHEVSDFDHDAHMLTSLCFVTKNADDSSFDMHGLVQFSTKKWLEINGELEHWKEEYVKLINESFPEGQPENWAICELLFPHAQAALNNHPLDADALEAWSSISWKAAWYMGERGEFDKAYRLALDSLEVREILLDPDDPEIFDSLNSVGVALSRLGRWEEAKMMYQRALGARERVFGVDHLDTLTSMLNLAQLLESKEQWKDAETLLQQILGVVSKKETEAGRSLTLSTHTTLATVYRSLGHYKEAADLELQILKVRESKLGSEHPTTLAVKGNLAYTYRHLGRLRSAETLNLQIINALEANHHADAELLATKAHLASVYLSQGRTSLAEPLHLEVLSTTKARLGQSHPDTLCAMAHLASSYWTQGRFDEALALQSQVLDLCSTLLGGEHPATLESKASLATTYWSLSRLEESEALVREVLGFRVTSLGAKHPLTLDCKALLSSVLRDQGHFGDAQMFEEEVLEVRTETLGSQHPKTLAGMGNLAVTLHRQGYLERAFALMEECYAKHFKVLGGEHPLTVGYAEGSETWRRGYTRASAS